MASVTRPDAFVIALVHLLHDAERLGRRQIGQDAGQARSHQRFTRTGQADHNQIVPARRRDLQRALGGLLTLHLAQIAANPGRLRFAWCRMRQRPHAPEMIEQRHQIGRGDDLD
jgi:hypothetical protein